MYSHSLSTPIMEKILEARILHESWKNTVRENSRIRSLVERLDQNVRASLEAMHTLGVTDACRQCEEEEGSCCGTGIENHYTSLSLMINLLMGVSLPDRRTYPGSCYFLGSNGCSLKVRHILCVNYLCMKIQSRFPRSKIIALQEIVGEELETGFILYEAIKKILQKDAECS